MATQRISRNGELESHLPVSHGRYYSACAKKDRYPTEQEALRIIARRRRLGGRDRLRFYECAFCSGYHLTKRGL